MTTMPTVLPSAALPSAGFEHWLRRGGDGLHRAADALRRWRLRRAERRLQGLFDELSPQLWVDLGVAEHRCARLDGRHAAAWRRLRALQEGARIGEPLWRQ